VLPAYPKREERQPHVRPAPPPVPQADGGRGSEADPAGGISRMPYRLEDAMTKVHGHKSALTRIDCHKAKPARDTTSSKSRRTAVAP
jgi:hypothetical protein